MKATVERIERPAREIVNIQAFWGQPFSEEIDRTPISANFWELVVDLFNGTQDPQAHLQAFQTQMYISEGNDSLSCKLFPGTLRGVVMHWLATFPARTIRSFNNLVFMANKMKQLEVADLFDIRQTKGESLKSYFSFVNATFNDVLALRQPTSMVEIKACTEKHVEAEEDKEDYLLA
ncbi:hypothetical protein CR513_61585, partial [Mucuna pruriens]